MDRIGKRVLVVLVILLLTNVLVRVVYMNFDQSAGDGMAAIGKIPAAIGPWQGTDYALEEQIFQILETRAIIHRNYTHDSQDVFVSIVYYPEIKVDFHAPEGCLAAEGAVINKTQEQISIDYNSIREIPLRINRIVRETRLGSEIVYYFYKAGDFMGDNYIQLRFNMIRNILLGRKKSGALIRVSTQVNKENPRFEDDPEILPDFINKLYPYLVKYL